MIFRKHIGEIRDIGFTVTRLTAPNNPDYRHWQVQLSLWGYYAIFVIEHGGVVIREIK